MRVVTLQGRVAALLGGVALCGVFVYVGVTHWPLPQLMQGLGVLLGISIDINWLQTPFGGSLIAAVLLLPFVAWIGHRATMPLSRVLRALEGAVASYRDGDFSFSIATRRRDELGDLVRMHNALGQTLRTQRQHLAERELLLDTVVQNTPVALVLADANQRVTYANIAARHLFNEGRSLLGLDFGALLDDVPLAMRAAIEAGEDTLFSVEMDGSEETFHISRRQFRLQGRPQRLYLFRRMTRELSRQEVQTWKKVIRVISHELNNSLAPISSLAHSGTELARRGDNERVTGVFATIGDRARHLHAFIDGYASFAKLPAPQIKPIAWKVFLDDLALHCRFRIDQDIPAQAAHFDEAQIEQVLINLVKNAHESGSAEDEVTLGIAKQGQEWRIDISDRGPGMSESVLAQALLPFYSTKRAGTGLGLALAREIVEAHDGRIVLANREGGGLRVSLRLPVRG
ncbi:MAG: ATP-binding protein [Rudaea sp.]